MPCMQFFYRLISDLSFLIVFSDMRGFASNLQAPPRRTHQASPSRPAPSPPARLQQQQASLAPPRQRERPSVGDKRRRVVEEPISENRRAMDSVSFLEGSRPSSREETSRHKRRREADRPNGQRGASAPAEADLAFTIERLLPHLRSMVSLLARTVTPSIEGKIMEKRGRAALDQAASMIVAIRHSSFIKVLLIFQVSWDR